MVKKDLVIIVDYSHETRLPLEEVCDICHVSEEFIHHLVAYDIIFPDQDNNGELFFNLTQLQRIKTVLRLQHDLEINLAGIAVVLDLLDKMEELRAKAELLDRHILK